MKFTAFGFMSQQGLDVEYLLVGGGAQGENCSPTAYFGFGGGGGGFVSQRALVKRTTAYPIVVGTGGDNTQPAGGSSSFAGQYAGGGNQQRSGYPQLFVNDETASCGIPTILYKAGGGGAAATGSTPYCRNDVFPQTGTGNNGGDGLKWLDGNYYAGGGGGGIRGQVTYVGLGGLGGGGNGGWEFAYPSGGIANTGGGGGGGGQFGGPSSVAGANGGTGIVKIRYAGSGSQATGGTISYSGSYTYHTFTASATFTTL
jgi:hypothetical protein